MSENEDLTAQHRPRRVKALFVGESSPADAQFYDATGNLFRATEEAFTAALGSEVVMSGEAFLKLFAARGCWLVDLVDRPVDQLPARERKAVLDQGVARLAEMLAETKPKHLIEIKAGIAAWVNRAIALSGVKAPTVLALRYPIRQWRVEYVARLAEFVKEL